MEEITSIGSGLCINIRTLNKGAIAAVNLAGKKIQGSGPCLGFGSGISESLFQGFSPFYFLRAEKEEKYSMEFLVPFG